MLRSITNAWTLIVNLGWVVVLGVIAAPHFLNQNSTLLKASPMNLTSDVVAPPHAMGVAEKPADVKVLDQVPLKAPEAVAKNTVGRRPIHMMTAAGVQDEQDRRDRQDRQQEPEKWETQREPGWPQQFVGAHSRHSP